MWSGGDADNRTAAVPSVISQLGVLAWFQAWFRVWLQAAVSDRVWICAAPKLCLPQSLISLG